MCRVCVPCVCVCVWERVRQITGAAVWLGVQPCRIQTVIKPKGDKHKKRRREKQKLQKQSSVTASWNTDNKSERAARLYSDINDSLRQQQQQPGSVEEGDWTAGVLRPPHSRQPTESNSGAFTNVCLFVFLVDTWSVSHYWISKCKHDCNRQLIIMHVFLSNI